MPEQVQECRRIYTESPSIRRVAMIMKGPQRIAKRAMESGEKPSAGAE